MKWELYNGPVVAHTFETRKVFNDVIGTYDDDPTLTSEVSYSSQLPDLGNGQIDLPDDMWAQEGYMTTNPTRQGLGYMMSFAASAFALRDNIKWIFVSSGSRRGGGAALAEKLGGEYHRDLEFRTSTGHIEKLGGYIIPVKTMNLLSAEGWANYGWKLTDTRD